MFAPARSPRRRCSAFWLIGSVLAFAGACSSDEDATAPNGWLTPPTSESRDATTDGDAGSETPVDSAASDGAATTSIRPTTSTSSSTESSERTDSNDSTSTSTSTSTTTTTTTTTIDPAAVEHAFPVDPDVGSSYTPQGHANYQAADIFSTSGCGTRLLSPVAGTVDEVNLDTWDPAVGDPATRGGNAVSIRGDDGVIYYLAHFQLVDAAVTPGARVTPGQYLGEMGTTGRSGACHVHFGLSLPCPEPVWWVRRGVIWPDQYLDAWRNGDNLSPRPELEAWFAEYPDACTSVENTPYPVG